MNADDLYVRLFASLQGTGELTPIYVGRLEGEAVTNHALPAIYICVQPGHRPNLCIGMNSAKLARLCVRESIRAGAPVAADSPVVAMVIARFEAASIHLFREAVSEAAAITAEARRQRREHLIAIM